jgi:SAM-dependent methyltransferase
MPDQPVARDAYAVAADAFAALAPDSPYNAHYERPAMLAMLPSVAGMRVLDAGCGPGIYTEWLAERGATVVGLDVTERMVELARARLGGRATFHVADLGEPLTMLEDGGFDLVLSPLAIDYVRDWHALFAEFRRVLRPGGLLVFSAVHPADEFYRLHPDGSYFDVELVALPFNWPEHGVHVSVPYYRRPLAAMIDPLLANGFALEQLVEPRPAPGFAERHPERYPELMRRPAFLCIRARRG